MQGLPQSRARQFQAHGGTAASIGPRGGGGKAAAVGGARLEADAGAGQGRAFRDQLQCGIDAGPALGAGCRYRPRGSLQRAGRDEGIGLQRRSQALLRHLGLAGGEKGADQIRFQFRTGMVLNRAQQQADRGEQLYALVQQQPPINGG